jgi:hypothetical protein
MLKGLAVRRESWYDGLSSWWFRRKSQTTEDRHGDSDRDGLRFAAPAGGACELRGWR